MKSPEEMAEYFRSMPKKKREPNPYWLFLSEKPAIVPTGLPIEQPIDWMKSKATLLMIRNFFRLYYESFHSEAQVLCVTPEDGEKLHKMGVPVLGSGNIGPFEVTVMVLPQSNNGGVSNISEEFWQNRIVAEGIKPVARIHSHHILDPYQSGIDYSTLNSGTMEIVIGRIYEEDVKICYWLDIPGTDVKAQTFVTIIDKGLASTSPRIFHGVNREDPHWRGCAANCTAEDDL